MFLIALLALVACSFDASSDAGDGSSGADATPSPDAGPSYSDGDWLFDQDSILQVDIEMPTSSWDLLRLQSRNIVKLLGEDCQGPSDSPFTYVKAKVTVDGEVVDEVGVRKKGFLGSLSDTKPSLKIKFNKFINTQRFSGWKRMTLNNAVQDPSYMNQCLGYQLFAKAGIPAPRCSFAKVSVNGDVLGLYVHVESVKKPFLGLHFDDDSGNMYEGTLSDFRSDWLASYERKTNKADPPGSEDRSDIQAVADAIALADDDAMLAALKQVIDVDEFLTFWAVETMVSHWDGYAGNNNNHFLYANPETGTFRFLPWGTDQLFGNGTDAMDPARTRSTITRRLFLHNTTREQYINRYTMLLDTMWDETAILAEINRMETLIRPELKSAELDGFNTSLAKLRSAISGREQRMRAGLASAGPGDVESLMEPLCFEDVGTLAATFDTLFEGVVQSLTMSLVVDGMPELLSNRNLFSGPGEDDPSKALLYFTADIPASRRIIVVVSLPNTQAVAGTIDLTEPGVESFLLYFPPGSDDPDTIYLMSGTLALTAAAPTAGAPWNGTLSAQLWDSPWF